MGTREMEQLTRRQGTGADSETVDVRSLVTELNAAFAVELGRRRAQTAGTPTIAEPDAGRRFAGGLLFGVLIGALTWAGIVGLLVLAA